MLEEAFILHLVYISAGGLTGAILSINSVTVNRFYVAALCKAAFTPPTRKHETPSFVASAV